MEMQEEFKMCILLARGYDAKQVKMLLKEKITNEEFYEWLKESLKKENVVEFLISEIINKAQENLIIFDEKKIPF
ncbi:hypothetical protein LH710_004423 [Vibrio vulnificus]|nr:hypothetical protein [Vibrio vulnificus]